MSEPQTRAERTAEQTAAPSNLPVWLGARVNASVEALILLASVFWLLSANRQFLGGVLHGRSLADPSAWGMGLAMVALVVALHVLLLGLVCNRWTVKPVLAVLAVSTALAAHFMGAYGIYLDPSMLRNVMRTDLAESTELMTPRMWLHLALYAGLPLLLLWRVNVETRPWLVSLGRRLALLLLALVVLVLALLAVFQPFSSLMRNNKELRYLITPANTLWSAGVVALADTRGAQAPRQAIGLDARPGNSWAGSKRPRVVLMVVGETARAASWGLNGSPRQTTPRLAGLPVVNFTDVRSCGTHTEASVPCMFAPVGRRNYDEARIRGQESLLHVVARAGVDVHWRDNQSGCKGVCEGLPQETVSAVTAPGLCAEGRCLDEALIRDLDERLQALRAAGSKPARPQLWVLHMLGNHGPSYHRRYPPAFARFKPECINDDLRQCSVEQITNSYDNALLYTDHVLASAIERLQAHAADVDSALLFVSDHGESLGEKGLFLHGMPYAIAPDEQTRVPMVFWASAGLEQAAGFSAGCLSAELKRQSSRAQSHDSLFHSLLGVLDVQTGLYEPALDFTSACRRPLP